MSFDVCNALYTIILKSKSKIIIFAAYKFYLKLRIINNNFVQQ